MVKNVFLIITALFLFVSCMSGRPAKRASERTFMYAMIYDHDNNPVSGVTVHVNGGRIAESDIQGRFIIDNMERGEYSIRLSKRGFETLEADFSYEPMQVLYFKIINTAQLLSLAEAALESRDYANADGFISRASALEPGRIDIRYLQAVSFYLQGKDEEAAAVLQSLIRSGNTDAGITRLLEMMRERTGE